MRILAFVLIIGAVGCQNPEQVNPVVYTLETQAIGQTSATFIGNLQDPGVSNILTYGFVWSETANPNVVTGNLIVLGERDVAGEFSALQEGLAAGTTYYVRAFVSDANFSSITYANVEDFTTLR